MSVIIEVNVPASLYLRDPRQTDLGRKIIQKSIELMDKIGFEEFTFKKLAVEIESTEASVYRYFENKHKLLLYLMAWYWGWLEYKILFQTRNIDAPSDKLKMIATILSEAMEDDPASTTIDEAALHNIVIAESAKAYLTKHVDDDNQGGAFLNFKSLCNSIAQIIRQINPAYPYPRALASTMVESALRQAYFSRHLPSLTEVKSTSGYRIEIAAWLQLLAFSALEYIQPAINQ
jgi:AcrR family transcriptional regulator